MKPIWLLLLAAAALAAVWWFGLLADVGWPGPNNRSAPAERVYQWKDEQGRLHYGDRAPADVQARELDLEPLNIVTLPKSESAPNKQATPLKAGPDAADTAENGDEPLPVSPSKQLRNPALERMGLIEQP